MTFSAQDQLFRHVEDHLPQTLDTFCILGGQKTIPGEKSTLNEMANYLALQLQKQNFKTQLVGEYSPLVYGALHNGKEKTLLLYSHYDVPGSTWHFTQPALPWQVLLQDSQSTITGNMGGKGHIVAWLAAIETYQALFGTLPVNLIWLIEGERERGSTKLLQFLTETPELLRADGCLCGGINGIVSGRPLLALGSKGLLRVELLVQSAETDLHSMHGAILPNAAWRLTWALNSLKDAREEVLIDGFYDTLQPADEDEIEHLHTLPDNAETLARLWQSDQLLLGLQGFQLHYTRFLIPTCTINGLVSNTMTIEADTADLTNVLPARARAIVDFYLVPNQGPQDIFLKLQRHLQKNGFQDIEARLISASAPTRTAVSDPFVQHIREAAMAGYQSEPYILPGSSENLPLAPLQQLFQTPIILTGLESENIPIHDFVTYIKFLTMIFERYRSDTTDPTA